MTNQTQGQTALTEDELNHCDNPIVNDWQKLYVYEGGFITSLMHAIERADSVNLKKLGTIYPKLVAVFLKSMGRE